MSTARLDDIGGRVGPRVLRYLVSAGCTPEDAADIFQETLLVAWRRSEAIPADDREALSWLIAVARRCRANHRRAGAARSRAVERLVEQVRLDTQSSSDLSLDEQLARLRPQDREILRLTYWEDLSAEQVARALEISPAGARKRLQRAREALAREVDPQRPGSAAAAAAQPVSVTGPRALRRG